MSGVRVMIGSSGPGDTGPWREYSVTPDRWNQIKDLMASALSVGPQDRAGFVESQAGGDDALRREVMSLLESHEEAGEFLEPEEAQGAAAEVETAPEPDLAGVRVGAYELVREIGRGGMGTVYLAARADNEFSQRVAVKLIRRGMESDFAVRRFRNERQILARLEHPHIARLLDGGTTGRGYPYFVMEFVAGEPLLAHCESRQLGLRERVAIFLKVCSAVGYAHRRMIVHRDLKPGNILISADGSPKLLDFGVAKILDPDGSDEPGEATLGGFRLVTPAYASPEQLLGDPATARSDIYALGIVLWELLTGSKSKTGGERSFELPDTEGNEPDLRLLRALRNVVLKAVRPKPKERYETVEGLAADLEKALAGVELAGATSSAEGPLQGSIAVLPFQFIGPDASEGYLGLGITDALITRLSNVGRIAVRPTAAVMKFAADSNVREAGKALNVKFVLEGLVQKVQARVRVTVQLLESETETAVWAAGFDSEPEDLLKVEDSISEQVAQALIPQLTGEERQHLAQSGTANAKAHAAYLRGRWYWNRHTEDALPQALVLFTDAIAEDPKYGRAYAGIADYHTALGARGIFVPAEAFGAAIQAASDAIALDPKLPEAHASLGFALWARDRDFENAAHHLQLAIALNPDYVLAHDWLGLMNSARGRPESAVASIERARRLDPQSPLYASDLALCHYAARRYNLAVAGFDPAFDFTTALNGSVFPLSLLAKGESGRAFEAARGFAESSGRHALAVGVLALTAAATGDSARAHSLLGELNVKARNYYVSGIALAMANLACGRRGEALTHLERACEQRDWWTEWLGLMPVWDELRANPRFVRMLRYQAAAGGSAALVQSAPPPAGIRRAFASATALGKSRLKACRARIAELLQIIQILL